MSKEVMSKVLAPRIERWKKMNEDFKRFDVKIEIARYFSLILDGQSLAEVYKELQRAKLHGANIIYTECLIDRLTLEKLRYEWGDEVYQMMIVCF